MAQVSWRLGWLTENGPFLANISGNLDAFDSVDRPASVAGLAPSRVISGRISGESAPTATLQRQASPNLSPRRPIEPKKQPGSRLYYDRKRSAANESPINRSHHPCPAPASTSSGPCPGTTASTRNQDQTSAPGCLTETLEFPIP